MVEADETFTVSLSNLAGTTLQVGFSSTATVTIEDDDRPTLTLGDVTVTEGDDPMTVTLTATLDIAVSGRVHGQCLDHGWHGTQRERLHHDHHDADVRRGCGRAAGVHGADPR